jgi:hypothetical protein
MLKAWNVLSCEWKEYGIDDKVMMKVQPWWIRAPKTKGWGWKRKPNVGLEIAHIYHFEGIWDGPRRCGLGRKSKLLKKTCFHNCGIYLNNVI